MAKISQFALVLTSARNLNILKQFISIHLKDLIMPFQKIVVFIDFFLMSTKNCKKDTIFDNIRTITRKEI